MAKLNKEQHNEFMKCATDFSYFCKTYIKVNGNQPFELYPYQERLYEHIEDNRYTIFSKFRQGGFTTELAMYSLWRCLFREDQHIFYVAHHPSSASASNLVKRAAQDLPSWMSGDIKLINEHRKAFPETNGSINFGCVKDLCGKNFNLLIIEEASFISDMEAHWKALAPIVTAGNCKLVIYSSANSTRDWFWKTLTGAINKKNFFSLYECDIDEHPEFSNSLWQDSMRVTLGKKGWACEYEQNAVHPETKNIVSSDEDSKKGIRSIFDEWEPSQTED